MVMFPIQFLAAVLTLSAATTGPRQVKGVSTIVESGGRLDWSATLNLIAFDRIGPSGNYEIYTMRPDGSDLRCLTCDKPELPSGHRGNPSWHPSGEYILFQAERDAGRPADRRRRVPRWRRFGRMFQEPDEDWPLQAGRRGRGRGDTSRYGTPGLGLHNDVWVGDRAGSRFWKVASSDAQKGGVLHPHFSHSGDKIVWSERIGTGGAFGGKWALKVANFRVDGGTPRLEDVRTYTPGTKKGLYESHGFSPDGRKLLFTAVPERGSNAMGLDIFTFDLKTKELTNLTDSPEDWDEHAHYTPSGKKIIWMSTRGIGLPAKAWELRSDYWIMNADGSDKQRLTYFNDSTSEERVPGGAVAADFGMSADGRRIAAYSFKDRLKDPRGRILLIELNQPQ
jgi:Tol biopolymer transport system component